MSTLAGKLIIVPTPVGNLEDITLRAIRILREVELILAEDTRTSAKLLTHYEITTPLRAYHMHNEHQKLQEYVVRIAQSQGVALISDAGTPGVSDPGFLLVRACLAARIDVDVLPGATAFVPALVMSGLPIDRFVFEGFLPQKKGRHKRLEQALLFPGTIALYESPFRVIRLMEELASLAGESRPVVVLREISKIYQERIVGSPLEVKAKLESQGVKGEFVVMVGPPTAS